MEEYKNKTKQNKKKIEKLDSPKSHKKYIYYIYYKNFIAKTLDENSVPSEYFIKYNENSS